jgi:hypothetical protein
VTNTLTATAEGTAEDDLSSAVLDRLDTAQTRLMEHPVYRAVDPESLPTFMEHHVFAVLDFMWLLKSLQVSLTSTAVAWTPEGDPTARRLVNEIVLGEESDRVSGRNLSHFELYVDAMHEAGADTAPVLNCVERIRAGEPVPEALISCGGPSAAIEFSLTTWKTASTGALHERIAAFAFGREEVIPDMFTRLLGDDSTTHSTFRVYLERHIEVDGDLHGPLALQLVRNSCGSDPRRWNETENAAITALDHRIQLWDAVLKELHARGIKQ